MWEVGSAEEATPLTNTGRHWAEPHTDTRVVSLLLMISFISHEGSKHFQPPSTGLASGCADPSPPTMSPHACYPAPAHPSGSGWLDQRPQDTVNHPPARPRICTAHSTGRAAAMSSSCAVAQGWGRGAVRGGRASHGSSPLPGTLLEPLACVSAPLFEVID